MTTHPLPHFHRLDVVPATTHPVHRLSLSKLRVLPATSALLCTGGTCRAQFGSQSFDLTHEQASNKAALQLARSVGNPASLDHARSIATADSLTAVDTRDVLNDEEVQPQATGELHVLLSTHVPMPYKSCLGQHLQLLLFLPFDSPLLLLLSPLPRFP